MKQIDIDLTFPANYECELFPELPSGDVEHYFYPNGATSGGKDGILIKVFSSGDNKWFGTFSGETISQRALNKVLTWADPNKICIVSSGTGFIIDVNNPKNFEIIDLIPILQVISSRERGMIIFASYTNLIAYSKNGFLWKTDRISWDGLTITGLNESHLEGIYRDMRSDTDSNFRVNLSNGEVEGEIDKFIS